MVEIKKEIPTGTIDGANKSFVLANAPYQIDDVFMDGAIYTTFAIVWDVLTLDDAPTLSLFVDYSVGNPNDTVPSDVTFGAVKNEVWILLGAKWTSTIFSDARVSRRINDYVSDIVRGRVVSMLEPNTVYRAGDMSFAEFSAQYRYRKPSEVVNTYAVGDVTIDCDTSGLAASGYVHVGNEIFSYSGKNATQLLAVSPGTVDHLAGETVTQLFVLPTYCDKPKGVFLTVGERDVEIPLNPVVNRLSFYELLKYGTDKLVKFVALDDESLVRVDYRVEYDDMDDDSDTVPIPDHYGLTVLAPLVAGSLAYQHGLSNGQQLLVQAYSAVKNMYSFFQNETFVVKQSIKAQPYAFNSIRR